MCDIGTTVWSAWDANWPACVCVYIVTTVYMYVLQGLCVHSMCICMRGGGRVEEEGGGWRGGGGEKKTK